MDNFYVWSVILVFGVVFSWLHSKAKYWTEIDNHNSYFKFLELWRVFIGYFFAGVVGYYFVSLRWPRINNGVDLSLADFILALIFIMCVSGWLPYFIKNVTEGINAIIAKILR